MTPTELRDIAKTAQDAIAGELAQPTWDELDGQYQSHLFDIARDIVARGGPATTYENAVAEAFAAFVATPPVVLLAVEGQADRDKALREEEKLQREEDERKRLGLPEPEEEKGKVKENDKPKKR